LVNATGRFTPRNDQVPIVNEPEWAEGPIWMGAENLPDTGIRSPALKKYRSIFYTIMLSLCNPRNHMGEQRYSCHSFLTSALDGGKWSASRSGRFTARRAPTVSTDYKVGRTQTPPGCFGIQKTLFILSRIKCRKIYIITTEGYRINKGSQYLKKCHTYCIYYSNVYSKSFYRQRLCLIEILQW
jgi:hypothetical protein